eukprot:6043845-Pyramimonas_sp.AAC.1
MQCQCNVDATYTWTTFTVNACHWNGGSVISNAWRNRQDVSMSSLYNRCRGARTYMTHDVRMPATEQLARCLQQSWHTD